MFSGMLAGFLKVAAIAVVTGGLAGGVIWAANAGGSEDNTAGTQPEASATVAVTPQSTPAPTATALPPTQPPPTEPAPTEAPPVPTADTRVPIRNLPIADQIQLRKDGKYFIADRGDGCTWVEGVRRRYESVGLLVSLFTDCPGDFFFDFAPETGEIIFVQE